VQRPIYFEEFLKSPELDEVNVLARTAIITLTTDFGLNDHFVGAMKGVILEIAPDATIIDISHAVQPFDILDGALTLSQVYSYYPSGTVHMVIVDPGVGTARRPIILTGDRHIFVAPDNGVLSLVYDREERISVRHVTTEHYFLQPRSNTFHARDIFSPIAAYLAKGIDTDRFGEEITDYVRFGAPRPKPVDERTLRGVVLKVDRFGNLITNITPQDAPQLFEATPRAFKIVVGSKAPITHICTSYAEGSPGEVFGIIGSMGFLEIATNRGSAFQLLGAGKGSEVNVVMEG
jgi:S-adenosyl-L-methionine hydrolase (adenosine-forming)